MNLVAALIVRRLICAGLLALPVVGLSAEVVKKTSSGICHPEQSSYYERVESFTPFTEVAACLESGGRLPKGLIIGDGRPESGYSRSKFGHGWKDIDGNGYDARADALISQSTGAIVFDPDNPKRVARGRWIVPYSGKIITNASETDADHVVPLNFAWRHGADKWSDDRRVQFANDPRNILITKASHNRSKGERGITEWLPPLERCGYIARFIRITKIYALEIPIEKQRTYNQMLDQCRR